MKTSYLFKFYPLALGALLALLLAGPAAAQSADGPTLEVQPPAGVTADARPADCNAKHHGAGRRAKFAKLMEKRRALADTVCEAGDAECAEVKVKLSDLQTKREALREEYTNLREQHKDWFAARRAAACAEGDTACAERKAKRAERWAKHAGKHRCAEASDQS